MNLWYIAIDLDDKAFNLEYCSEFGYRTGFISNYLSKQIRKASFKTDETFRMISVRLGTEIRKPEIVLGDVLEVGLVFDQGRYEQIKGTEDCSYYLEIFEEGFRRAAEFKKIPLETLLNLIDEFSSSGCKNEWLHKKKRFKEADIEVALNCCFTTLDFRLVATIIRISTKEELCSGVVLITEPDEIHFDYKFKDILIDEESIIITDSVDEPRILIDLKKAFNGKLVSHILPMEFNV